MSSRVGAVFGTGNSFRGRLVRGGAGSLTVKLAGTLLAVLVAIILARALGPDGYGIYALVYAVVTLLAIPAQLGLPELMVRETAKAHAREQWGVLRGLWRWGTASVFVFSIILLCLGLAGIWIIGERLGVQQQATFLFGLFLVPLVALGNLRGAALKGLRRVVLGQLPQNILRPGLLILFLMAVLVLFPSAPFTPAHAMALHAVAAVIAFGVGAWILWNARPNELKNRPLPVYIPREWFGAAFPLALIAGIHLINQHTDILMIGIFCSMEEVGIYKVVVTGATLVAFGLQAVNVMVAPYFARLHTQGELVKLQRLVTLSARAILALAIPVVALFLFKGDVVLGLVFGEEYAVGHSALAILALGQLVNAATGSVGTLLNMTGHERDTMRGLAVAAVANVLLNLALIPAFGIVGAAFATAISLVLWNFLLWWFVRNRLGIESMAFGIKAKE
ncbi:MAG: flippase [Aquisalimonadaceae bacterium]